MLRTALALTLVLGMTAQAAPRTDLVKAQLLADVSTIQPGKRFTLGVLMQIEPGWHIYWTNPGDSGSPTRIKVIAPQGFKVDAAQFPTPSRFDQPGDLVGYGYHDEVMLLVPVTAPDDLKPGDSIKFDVVASWLCCEDVCIPGKQDLSITLPVAAESAAENADLFMKWKAEIPVIATSDPLVERLTVERAQRAAGESDAGSLTFVIDWRENVKDTVWFPPTENKLTFTKIDARTPSQQTRINFDVALRKGQTIDHTMLDTVLSYVNQKGQRKGIVVPIDIRGVITPTGKN